jgi:diadenosine tetraphosphatase ApaH/serine/threonine PP2A family protein phosphatase
MRVRSLSHSRPAIVWGTQPALAAGYPGRLRAAVISDIHANLPALEAVLEGIEATAAEEIWCLGDVVGYGAQPDECADLVRERCAVCLVGNHDLAVLGALDLGAFSESAAEAVRWTQASATAQTLEFLRELEPAGERQEIGLFHASPRDPVWEYVLSVEQAEECLDAQRQRLGLIGHSHTALFFTRPESGERDETRGEQASDGKRLDVSGGSWLLNPGSVGQPRDGDPRAAWLELDTEAQTARFHRASYDVDQAARSIAAAGLPTHLAGRLYAGR